jgi:hypothetical protein
MQLSRRWQILALLVFIGNALPLFCWAINRTGLVSALASALSAKADLYAAVAAGGAFSLLGFLAAVMALFSLIGQSSAMIKYRKNGHLWILLSAMAVTMIETSVAFVLAISLFFSPVSTLRIELSLISLSGSLGMILVCMVPSLMLQLRAALEP